jgi:hypothetical protein
MEEGLLKVHAHERHFLEKTLATAGLYYKHVKIINVDSSVVSK